MVLGIDDVTVWLVNSLFKEAVYTKAKKVLGEDAFSNIGRKALNEAIKDENNLMVWNKINESNDITLKDTRNLTAICESIPVEHEKCHTFFSNLQKEFAKELYSRGEDDPVQNFLLDQMKDQWMEGYQNVLQEYPEEEVRAKLAEGLLNAAIYYRKTKKFSEMEECISKLKSLHAKYPEKGVRAKLAVGLYHTAIYKREKRQFSEMEEYLNKLRSLHEKYPEKAIRPRLGMGLVTAINYYGKNNRISEMEEWLTELRSLYKKYPEKEVGHDLAGALVNVTAIYGKAQNFSKMKENLNKLRSLYAKYPEKAMRLKLGMGLVAGIATYGGAKKPSKMEKCLKELKSLHEKHPDIELNMNLASGLYNALILNSDMENHFDDFLLLYKLSYYLPNTLDKLERMELIKEKVVTLISEKLKHSDESAMKETIDTIQSQLSETNFLLLINEVADMLPWKTQKILWKIINKENSRH